MNNKLIVDISKWNYPVDFSALKNHGVSGVIIRAGSGKKEDERAREYTELALKYVFDIGFYWFVYNHDGITISENTLNFEKTISPYKNKITLDVWCDYEYHTDEQILKYDNITLNKNERTKLICNFCDTMQFFGYSCGVYSNLDYLKNKFNNSVLKKYPLWFARYTSDESKIPVETKIWQFTNKLKINNKLFDGNYIIEKIFYPRITVTQAFDSCNIPSDYESRKKIAIYNGLKNYCGTVGQNAELIEMLANGILKNPF